MSVDHFHNEESTGSIEIPEGTLDVVIHEWSSNYTTHTQKTVNGKDWIEKTKNITDMLTSDTYDAVVVTAGGWAGGHIGEIEGLYGVDEMWTRCAQSAAMGGYMGSKLLNVNGLLVFTGASVVASGGTSFMAGYGMAKAATHHLVQSIASGEDLASGSTVLAVLPETIDTPTNRTNMPDADVSSWTPMEHISDEIFKWAETNESRPDTGSLLHVHTKDGNTEFVAYS
jgi:dihydropteridine reductase